MPVLYCEFKPSVVENLQFFSSKFTFFSTSENISLFLETCEINLKLSAFYVLYYCFLLSTVALPRRHITVFAFAYFYLSFY